MKKGALSWNAFPVAPYPGDDVNPPVAFNTGVNARDLCLFKVLQGIMANPSLQRSNVEETVEFAFDVVEEVINQYYDRL